MPESPVGSANPAAAGPSNLRCRLGWGWIACLLVLQVWSRYLPAPQAVLVADDWSNLARSSFYPTHLVAAATGLQDPNRPLSMGAVEVGFRLFGATAWRWTLLSLVANSLLLLTVAKMALELTERRGIAVAAGMVFALWPNLTETYHWSTQVLNEVTCALVPYALSGWLGVAYLRRGGGWRLALSALAYGVGLFSYEAGILLPGAFLALIPWRRGFFRGAGRMAPYALVGLLYVAWRITDSFGLNQSWVYPPHMQASLSLAGVVNNARLILRAWCGDHFFGSVLYGLLGFSQLPFWTRWALVAGNVAVAFAIGRWAGAGGTRAGNANGPAPFAAWQMVLFALAWTGAAWAISLLAYTGARLNVLPAIGISLLAAMVLERVPSRRWRAALFVPAVLALLANQGTSGNFRQAGDLNQRLFTVLQRSAGEWRDKEYLLFDTRALRHRLTTGLAPSAGNDQQTWALYGNAPLMRGFTLNGMVQLAAGRRAPGVHVLLDVEYGARIDGERLIWHERYDPSRPRTNSMDEVYVVDCLDAGKGLP